MKKAGRHTLGLFQYTVNLFHQRVFARLDADAADDAFDEGDVSVQLRCLVEEVAQIV